jgi:hypothetical protein
MARFRISTIKIDKIEADPSGRIRSVQFELRTGTKTPAKTIEARKVAEIIPAVAEFETELAASHPDTCFRIFVDIEKGFRKPAGFDAATAKGGILHDRFTNPHVVTVRREDTPARESTHPAL